jgi:hypothetical protein
LSGKVALRAAKYSPDKLLRLFFGRPSAPPANRLTTLLAQSASRKFDVTRIIAALLVIGLYYNWYRYPFKINSQDTSPTYADTPVWLSMGKYVLIAAVLLYAVVRRVLQDSPVRITHPPLLGAFSYLAFVPLLTGVALGEAHFIEIGLSFLVPLVLIAFSGWRIDPGYLNKLLALSIYAAIAVEVIQVFLFFQTGRLPALAYSDSFSVRFGSFMDDPNGFGIVIAWMLAFAWTYFKVPSRLVLTVLLGACLLLTQSLTAIAATAIVGVLYLLIAASRGARRLLLVLTASGAALVAAAAVFYTFERQLLELYRLFMLTKAGSIEGHAESLDMFRNTELLSVIGIEPAHDLWGESGYGNLLAFFGLGYLLVYWAVGLAAAWTYLKIVLDEAASPNIRAFAAGALGLLTAVYAASVNLPLSESFPLNLLAATFVGIATAGLVVDNRKGGYPRNEATKEPALSSR